MECMTTASTSVLVNGSPSGAFNLQKGLRQGDPLSPFIFLLVAEGLSLLMKKATNGGFFAPAEIGRNKIGVSHLQFEDDTIFLGSASVENARVMKRILKIMELVSGLRVNYDKCWLFGINVSDQRLNDMATILDCRIGSLPFSYLGIKVGIYHRKATEWKEIVNKIKGRLQRWEGHNFSFGGRITLLNSVLSSLPTYYLSFY